MPNIGGISDGNIGSQGIGSGAGVIPPPAFCAPNLTSVDIRGVPTVVVTPPGTFLATNPAGGDNARIYYNSPSYQTATQTVHQELYYDDAFSTASPSAPQLILAYSETNDGNQANIIAGAFILPNNVAGAGMGIMLDATTFSPVLTNMTVPVGTYEAATDLDHNTKTCAFKDNQGQSAALGTKASAWELSPVFVASMGVPSTTVGDFIEHTWNPGFEEDRLTTIGSVRPCEAA